MVPSICNDLSFLDFDMSPVFQNPFPFYAFFPDSFAFGNRYFVGELAKCRSKNEMSKIEGEISFQR